MILPGLKISLQALPTCSLSLLVLLLLVACNRIGPQVGSNPQESLVCRNCRCCSCCFCYCCRSQLYFGVIIRIWNLLSTLKRRRMSWRIKIARWNWSWCWRQEMSRRNGRVAAKKVVVCGSGISPLPLIKVKRHFHFWFHFRLSHNALSQRSRYWPQARHRGSPNSLI